MDFTNHSCVGDITVAVNRDVVIVDGPKSICSLHSWFGRFRFATSNALAQSSKFVGIGLVPGFFVGWVGLELSMFKFLTHVNVKNRACITAWFGGCICIAGHVVIIGFLGQGCVVVG